VKAEIVGARAGARQAAPIQPVKVYGRYWSSNFARRVSYCRIHLSCTQILTISCIDAPPVARAGEPIRPWKRRAMTRPEKDFAVAATAENTRNKAKLVM